jgi:hypothetical protein
MVVYGLNPSQGPTAGHTLVTITGENLPVQPTVHFGARTASVIVVAGDSFIVVDTPAGEPGPVDVRVVDAVAQEEVTLPDAFAYLADSEGPIPTTRPQETTPAPVTSTTVASGTTTSLSPGTMPAPTTAATSESLDSWRDSLLTTPDGLRLVPVASGNPIAGIPVDVWVGALCDEAICPGWVMRP